MIVSLTQSNQVNNNSGLVFHLKPFCKCVARLGPLKWLFQTAYTKRNGEYGARYTNQDVDRIISSKVHQARIKEVKQQHKNEKKKATGGFALLPPVKPPKIEPAPQVASWRAALPPPGHSASVQPHDATSSHTHVQHLGETSN